MLADYDLTDEEHTAIAGGDIGKLYLLRCNGQWLMHCAPLLGVAWADYLEAMREGVRRHGPVRAGIYAMTTSTGTTGVTGITGVRSFNITSQLEFGHVPPASS